MKQPLFEGIGRGMQIKKVPIRFYASRYAVTSTGLIVNMQTGRILKPGFSDGYHNVNLCRLGRRKSYYVHRLVAQAFITEPRAKNLTVHHKNYNKTDNRVQNLEWLALDENVRHMWYKRRRVNVDEIPI